MKPKRSAARRMTPQVNQSSRSKSFALLFLGWLSIQSIECYIPALPSNDSLKLSSPNNDSNHTNSNNSSNNILDPNWIIQLNWNPIGIFSDGITHQLKSDSSNHSIYQGVLLHFSEFNATSQPPAMVPWIAMINCDSNSTNFSIQDDIFTLARDRGAAAAMLYSLTSQSCQVNQEYLQNFGKPLDVFSAANLQGARLIESQFSNVLGAGYWFQSGLLNSSAPTVLQQIKSLGLSNLTDLPSRPAPAADSANRPSLFNSSDPQQLADGSIDTSLARRSHIVEASNPDRSSSSSSRLVARSSDPHSLHLKLDMNVSRHRSPTDASTPPVYLIATLANADVAANLNAQRQDTNQNSRPRDNPDTGNNSNTGLAMIVLYAITGCVSFMFRFLVCILSFACLPLPLLLSPHTHLGRFLIVIVSGAIRAIRNPDRYGPRPGRRVNPHTGQEDPYALPRQTRAEGLGKAILDTFPIVKFGRQRNAAPPDSEGALNDSDFLKASLSPASPSEENILMRERDLGDPSEPTVPSTGLTSNKNQSVAADLCPIPTPELSRMDPIRQLPSSNSSSDTHISQNTSLLASKTAADVSQDRSGFGGRPPAILSSPTNDSPDSEDDTKIPPPGQSPGFQETSKPTEPIEADGTLMDVNNSMTCPICVCDFEEDDDIRMLPCDARHQFHKECVDPWLLNESKFCPLCRWDLSTRKDGSKIVTPEVAATQAEESCSPGSTQPLAIGSTSLEEPTSAPQGTQSSQASDTSPASRGSLSPWLPFRHRPLSSPHERLPSAQSGRAPDSPNQHRTSQLLSIVPQALKRRMPGNSATENMDVNDQSTSAQSSSPHTRATTSRGPHDDDDQEESMSRSRFFRYLGHIRRTKRNDQNR